MEGRGLWVFMSDGAPVDPEEEDGVAAAELDILRGHGDDEQDEDEDFSGLMDEEVREELVQAKKAEKRALRELAAIKRLLDEAEGGADGDLLRVMRQEMDQTKQEMAGVQVAQLCKAKLLIGPFGGQQLTDNRSVRGRGTCESSHRRHAKLQRG